MNAPVDEKTLSGWICANGQKLAPLALIALSLLIMDGDGWLTASATSALLLVYAVKRWDGMWLSIYGIAMLAACGILMFSFDRYVDWAALQAYWLLVAGTVWMVLETIKAPVSRTENQQARRHTRNPL